MEKSMRRRDRLAKTSFRSVPLSEERPNGLRPKNWLEVGMEEMLKKLPGAKELEEKP